MWRSLYFLVMVLYFLVLETLRVFPLFASGLFFLLILRFLIAIVIYTWSLLWFSLSLFLTLFFWVFFYRKRFLRGERRISENTILTGFLLFVFSEILFFSCFFWTYFHFALVSSSEIGAQFPPFSFVSVFPFGIPLFNTMLLLSSGVRITYGHKLVISGSTRFFALLITIILGSFFELTQFQEFNETLFCISDSSFGSIFFMLTGFHGFHVLLGLLFLFTCFIFSFSNRSSNHPGFVCSVWYWHFVDVVWLFLFCFLYIWSY